MWPLLTGLMGGASSLIGSIFSSETSASNTQAQIAGQQSMLNQSEQFNAQQAQINRDYQTQMSNTAFQRSRADAEKAGLNPMVLAGMGGASSPGGSSASVGTPSFPPVQNTSAFSRLGEVVERSLTSAINAKSLDKMTEEISNLRVQNALTRQVRETEVGRSEEAAARGVQAVYGIPGARFAAKQAEALEKLPSWLSDVASQGGYLSDKGSKVMDLVSPLLSSAKGFRGLLQYPDEPTKVWKPSDRQYMKDTFDELWDRRSR